MTFGALWRWIRLAVLTFAATLPAASACRADETAGQFWPQLYLIKQAETDRTVTTILMLSLTNDRATRDMTDGEIGLDVAFQRRPNNLFRVGYHYLRSNLAGEGGPQTEHRINLDAGAVWRPLWNVNFYDRNRIELRDVNGDLSWRYRNRVRLEKNFTVRGWVSKLQLLTPYTMAELTYDPRRSGIVRWRYDLGVLTNMSRNTLIDLYVARQNSINPDSSNHVNAFGMSLTYLLDK